MTDPGVRAPMHKNVKTTLPRISNFITSSRFQETNLVGRLYPDTHEVDLSHWYMEPKDGSDEGEWENYEFDAIIKKTFSQTEIGTEFGPTWSTHWFKIEYKIPQKWQYKEVRFRWISGSEATIWSPDGVVLQGLSTGTDSQLRTDYILTSSFSGSSESQTLYVEMAGSRMFGASLGDQIDPPDPNLVFKLTKAELAVMDTKIYSLIRDLEVLYQIADNLLEEDPRGYMAMHTANQMINLILDGKDDNARDMATQYFSKKNGSRAHVLATIGNCHIDSAWLWPFSETKRKVARSFSSQLQLMEDYPEHIFVASQAQQWAWCKEYYEELFERIKSTISNERAKFLPVGSTWTEMDGNIPSGESFIRQFFYGQKFFSDELNYECQEFWLPDTFGYNGQIPGLMKHVGLSRFLTQKMSWSLVNKFPHHNFLWEGIDGSKVLAHFPPGDSYSMNVTVSEAKRTERNLRDKGRVSTSAFLFGYGDGGGGPTQDMLERRRRLEDADGCPKMVMMTPNELFEALEKEQDNMMKWVGELFLELHNGTYTSQASMKQYCRLAEFRLRDAELLLASAVGTKGADAKAFLNESLRKLEIAWKKVLLNQFHDVLPGTGIAIIYPQAKQYYKEAIQEADAVFLSSVQMLFGSGSETVPVLMNTLQWPRREVIDKNSPLRINGGNSVRGTSSNQSSTPSYALVDVPPFGYSEITSVTPTDVVKIEESNGSFIMSNGLIRAEVSNYGQLKSLKIAGNDRDLFIPGQFTGNQITLYDDEPLYWDAWDVMDYHLETANVLNTEMSSNVTSFEIVENSDLVGRLKWDLKISEASKLTQEIELLASSPYLTFNTTVQWHESHKMLKTNFDANLHVRNASYDIQFGFIERATHMNTSWDSARYEVCGHKWADISEPNFGMTLLNDCKYGWEGRGSALTLSLLKAPKAPDDTCDMGTHIFRYAVMPHQGTLQEAEVMRRGYEFNNPLRIVEVDQETVLNNSSWPLFAIEGEGIILHTIKAADDGSGDIIIRLFENHGCRSSANLVVQLACSAVMECNGREINGNAVKFTVDPLKNCTTIGVSLTPFAIYALRLCVQ